jgi:ABC-type branched-subunit amino acid transport system substrate-binding protein
MFKVKSRLSIAVALLLSAIATSQAEQKKYDPGATDTEIKIGNIMPYSGPLSAFSAIGRAEEAYFKWINDAGGINGRKINFISYDDASNPSKTLEQTRKLIEGDEALLIFSPTGTAQNVAIQKYLNSKGVPHIFLISGAARWADPNFPWSISWYPSTAGEANLYAKFVLKNYPNAKIALLSQNDDSGKDQVRLFKNELGEKASMIVAERSVDISDPTIDSQIVFLKDSGADLLYSVVGPKPAVQSAKKVKELGWKPVYLQAGATANLGSALEFADGVITASFTKQPNDSRWQDDPDVREYLAILNKSAPNIDKNSSLALWGYTAAQAMVQVLKQCGDNLTRENVMKQTLNLKNFRPKMFLPGIGVNTSPTNYYPILEEQMLQYDLKNNIWRPIAEVTKMEF